MLYNPESKDWYVDEISQGAERSLSGEWLHHDRGFIGRLSASVEENES